MWRPLFSLEVELPKGKRVATATSTAGRRFLSSTQRGRQSVGPPSASASAPQHVSGQGQEIFSAASIEKEPVGPSAPSNTTAAREETVAGSTQREEDPLTGTNTTASTVNHSRFVSLTGSSFRLGSAPDNILEELERDFQKNVLVDNYGFYVSLEEKAAETALLRRKATKKNDHKWASDILPRWNRLKHRDRMKFCRKGVPQSLRKPIWLMLLQVYPVSTLGAASPQQKASIAAYEQLAAKPFSEEEERHYGVIIEKDLPRTFGTNILFDRSVSPAGQEQLRRLLRAYCHRNPRIGYCQGMASVAATLVLLMESDYDAYISFCALMERAPYHLQDYYAPGFPELNHSLYVLEGLLKKTSPSVWKVVRRCSVPYAVFATSWLLTLFSHSFNFRLVCRIWDMFLCEGWKPVFRVVIALLKMDQERMERAKDEGEVLMLLQHATEEKDPQKILEVAQGIGFQTVDMKALRNKSLAG